MQNSNGLLPLLPVGEEKSPTNKEEIKAAMNQCMAEQQAKKEVEDLKAELEELRKKDKAR